MYFRQFKDELIICVFLSSFFLMKLNDEEELKSKFYNISQNAALQLT